MTIIERKLATAVIRTWNTWVQSEDGRHVCLCYLCGSFGKRNNLFRDKVIHKSFCPVLLARRVLKDDP